MDRRHARLWESFFLRWIIVTYEFGPNLKRVKYTELRQKPELPKEIVFKRPE